jgi:hypothetical protein
MNEVATLKGPMRGPLRRKESNLWAREKNDHYVEPRFVSERLFAVEKFDGEVIDPSCGFGNIVLSARAAGLTASGYDIVHRSDICEGVKDFMDPNWSIGRPVMNIFTNPPFGICDPGKDRPLGYVDLALRRAERKVAMVLPANWVQGDARSRWMATTPLRRVLFITPRPSMPPGHVIAAGGKPGNGTTDYAVFIWHRGYDGRPEIGWLRRDDA